MAKIDYRFIHKYIINAKCIAPLHIGAANGEKGDVLVHPVTGLPFIQASSIAGVLRNTSEVILGKNMTDRIFGASRMGEGRNSNDYASRLKVSDGIFENDTLKMELRPRVAIDAHTGSVNSSKIAGSGANAGHKFEMESVAAGAVFKFDLYLFDDDMKAPLEKVLSVLKGEFFQIGGQKSNGEGFIQLIGLWHFGFDMTDSKSREQWRKEDQLVINPGDNMIEALELTDTTVLDYKIVIQGKTSGSLLVKGIAVTEGYGEKYPDVTNLQNANQDYIVPGSSLKGALKAQASIIADRFGVRDEISNIFGYTGSGNNKGRAGCIQVLDTVIGERYDNDMASIQHHIHIDKFTGGVMDKSLFSEKNTCGALKMEIHVSKSEYSEFATGIMILTARDMAAGLMNIGSGYSTGKGFIDVDTITIYSCKENRKAVISYRDSNIDDATNLIRDCLAAIKTLKNKYKDRREV